MDFKAHKYNILFGLLLISFAGFSQTEKDRISKQDSLTARAKAYFARQFAVARPLNIEFTHMAPYQFVPKENGTSAPKNKVDGFTQLKVSAGFDWIKKRTWMLGSTLGYKYTNGSSEIIRPSSTLTLPTATEFHYLYGSLNLTYFSKLFGKTMIYTSNITVDGSEQHFERTTGLITGTMILKANERTRFMVGAIVSIDPTSEIPVIPSVVYEHRFGKGWMVDILLPKQLMLRKHVFKKGRLSAGTELDRTSFYLYNINPEKTSQKYEYRQVELNNGLVYEHLIADNFILTARTGMKWIAISRIFEKNGSFNDAVYETKTDPAFYFNLGVSFNPFIRKKAE